MNLDEALRQFDRVEANLVKADGVLRKMMALVPDGLCFMGGSDEDREYRRLHRDFEHILEGLPAIDGWRIPTGAMPEHLDVIAQWRLDAKEAGEFEAKVAVEQQINEPEHLIDEYRSRLARKRRQLVRARLEDLVTEVDGLLAVIGEPLVSRDDAGSVRTEHWERLEGLVDELDRLLGTNARPSSWSNLRRHLSFAMGCDYYDIKERDWPTVKRELQKLAYDDTEPMPVAVTDLGELVASRPAGVVSTALNWAALDDEGFERLIFTLISNAPGYENPEWLTKTRASDRGRDLSVQRVRTDALSGVSRERVILQCKHWQKKSVGDTDVANAVTKMSHWEPPPVDVLVVVTSGCFTDDAVRWVENHNHQGKRPRVEPWAKSHLEQLLARHPHVAVALGLR